MAALIKIGIEMPSSGSGINPITHSGKGEEGDPKAEQPTLQLPAEPLKVKLQRKEGATERERAA